MCDGKHSSKRDVVILSIKPRRPEFSSSVKVVPVSELLQEWDKLDAYYRGQLLKLTKSINKTKSKSSRHPQVVSPSNKALKNSHTNDKVYPVNKKHSSSLSSDQFTDLFGDENLFSNGPSPDSNNNSRSHHPHNHQKSNKLLHSRSLNSLFDEDEVGHPVPRGHPTSRKSSNLVVSIPVLSVQHRHNHDSYNNKHKWASDDEDEDLSQEESDTCSEGEDDNFLSVPRDNFQVQYGTKQKTRVALLETGGNVSPRWIVPVRVAPYKPPAAQGLNGVQIQKILYHKNDSINFASPTTTSARTPDKPPDNHPPQLLKAKISESPGSTVSPRSTASTVSPRSTISSGSTTVSPRSVASSGSNSATPPPSDNNNNATPKQIGSFRTPELSPSLSDQGSTKSTYSSSSSKLSPPVNSTTGNKTKTKRPVTDSYSSGHGNTTSGNSLPSEKKKRRFESNPSDNSGFNFIPVTSTSSTYGFNSSGTQNSNSSGCLTDSSESSETTTSSPKKPNKNLPFKKSSSSSSSSSSTSTSQNTSSSSAGSGDHSGAVFLPPAAVSITDRIIKKASRPQPELLERQRRRLLQSNQRKSYAMQKGSEHEQRESIDLSMKSFEMIWNVPLLSPLRSP